MILDEAWFLLSSSQGRALVNRLVRFTRRYNATVLLLTQLLEDAPVIRELVRTWFIFGQDSEQQAELGLRLAGVEPTDARIRRLQAAVAGRCVMRDLRGRVAEIQIDVTDPELLAALNTAPPIAEAIA